MHAVVVRVTIHDADGARKALRDQVVPRVSSSPGFKSGYWTWPADGEPSNGLSMVFYDDEDSARKAADMVGGLVPDAVTLDGVEVREVVESA